MGRYDQAPKLVNKKPKMDNNIIMVSNEIYSAIFNAVGRKYLAGALLVWFIGQADGFGIAQQTAMNALGISRKQSYYDARDFLEELGFITVIDGISITIHYDKILGYEKRDSKNRVNETETQNRVAEKETQKLSNENRDSIFMGNEKRDPKGNEKRNPMGHENRDYNIEEHIKTYKESQEKLGCEKRDSILGNEKRDPILTLKNFKTTVYQNSYLDEYNATGEEILDSYDFTDDGEIEEMSNEFPEAYSDLVKLGVVKRKEWVF